MSTEGLEFINSCIGETLKIPYEFMLWKSEVPDTYWIGEYQEVPNPNEDGKEETDFIITGTTNKSFLELERTKEEIKGYFDSLTTLLESGSGIAIIYESAYPIPSVEQGVYRLQINLKIKEWRV